MAENDYVSAGNMVDDVLHSIHELIKAPGQILKGMSANTNLPSGGDILRTGAAGKIARQYAGGEGQTTIDPTHQPTWLDKVAPEYMATRTVPESDSAITGVDWSTFGGAKGMNKHVENTPAVRPSTPPVPAAPAVVGNQGPAKPTKDIYDFLNSLSDDRFKQFLQDHPNQVPGVGYVESGEKGQEGYKFLRSVERPKPNNDLANMTYGEAGEFAKILHGVGAVATGIGHQQYAAATQAGNLEAKRAAIEEKQLNDWKENIRKKSSRRTNPETGAVEYNERAALADEFISNRANIPAKLLPEAQAAWTARQKYIVQALRDNPDLPPDKVRRKAMHDWITTHSWSGQ